MIGEFDLIERLKKKIPKRLQGLAGIGDDTAMLAAANGWCQLFTTDAIVDGIDFHLKKARPEAVGRKALAINLSDIAAMGGRPTAFVVSLGIPKNLKTSWTERFYAGMMKLARKYRVACVGGDISRAPRFFACVALTGRVLKKDAVRRSGARPGDLIGVTGRLGGSIRGHHFSFEPRLREAAWLSRHARPHAMMDVSDGLLQDLGHLLTASGVGGHLDLDRIPIAPAAWKQAKGNKKRALNHALSDGEDFELLFTVPPARRRRIERLWRRQWRGVPLSWIGTVRRGRGRLSWQARDRKGRSVSFRKKGYTHF